jgi:hypothetical protein
LFTIDKSGTAGRTMELAKELPKPARLRHTVGDGAVLGLGAGPGHGVLALRRPGDQVGTKEDTESGSRAVCVRTTSPISVTIGKKIVGGGAVKLQAIVRRTTQVAENPLEELIVHIERSMHDETKLLDGVGDIWPCQGKIL